MPLLKQIVTEGYEDVREALVNYRRQQVMGQIFPSIDGICVEEEKTLGNDDTIEQSMSNNLFEVPSSLSLR